MALKEPQVRVQYVGKKPFTVDNIAGSGKCWNGAGDIQVVTESQGEKLAAYADQWKVLAEVEGSLTNEDALKALKELGADPTLATPHAKQTEDANVVAAAIKAKSGNGKAKSGSGKAKAKTAEKATVPAVTPPAGVPQVEPTPPVTTESSDGFKD